MCTNSYYTYNKYTHQRILVPCGHCPACLQAKANKRATRIRNHSQIGEIPLFVTLTYAPDYIPYIKLDKHYLKMISYDNFHGGYPYRVYRNFNVRWNYHKDEFDKIPVDGVFDTLYLSSDEHMHILNSSEYPRKPVGSSGENIVGVALYSDVQRFIKRLRINLQRKYNYEYPVTYYSCSEYGPTTDRPHFHLLIYTKSSFKEEMRRCIVESWPFADSERTSRFVEEAIDASSYVASYVNSSNSRLSVFSKTPFAPSHSYSQGFGVRCELFSLRSVLEKFERCDFTYSYKTIKDKVTSVSTLPIPKYVINRYFPKFKGYSLVSDDEIRELLFIPSKLCHRIWRNACERGLYIKSSCGFHIPTIMWSNEDTRAFCVRMLHVFDIFHRELGWSVDRFYAEYPLLYVRVWNLYKSTTLRFSYNQIKSVFDYLDFYENAVDLYNGEVRSDLDEIIDVEKMQLDFNRRKDVVHTASRLTQVYHLKDKNRKVVNACISNNNYV